MHAYFPALTSWPSLLGDMLADAINCLGFTWVNYSFFLFCYFRYPSHVYVMEEYVIVILSSSVCQYNFLL